jgi:Late competence development protein ComFB
MTPLPYRNALEPLVAEEVQRQLETLPPRLVAYINSAEVIAYALNRLPALYATSEEGWNRQQQKAKTQLEQQIILAVKWGLNAVFQDPLSHSTPLRFQHETIVQQDEPVFRDVRPDIIVQLWP